MFASALGVFFLDGVGSGTRKRPPGTILGIPFLAFLSCGQYETRFGSELEPGSASRRQFARVRRLTWASLERPLERPWGGVSRRRSVTWSVT